MVTSRLCLDQIRSARSRRERPHDASEIEFVPGSQPPVGLQPPPTRPTGSPSTTTSSWPCSSCCSGSARPSESSSSCTTSSACRSTPSRETVGRPAATCRQLARRARQKIEDGQGGATVDVGAAEHRQVTEKFIAACATGDLDGLLEVLAPDAWGDFDAGPDGPRGIGVVRGAIRVARHLLHYGGRARPW